MENLNKEIGKRLRGVRDIFHEGVKLTADQLAFMLDETGDRIRNYEIGRAAIQARTLVKLYQYGINPTYLLTGEGEIFADNRAGKERKRKLINNFDKGKLDEGNNIIRAAAGRLDE